MIAPPTYRPLDKPPKPPPKFHPAWLAAAVVVVPLVVLLQQFTLDLRSQSLSRAPEEIAASEEPREPGISELTLASKFVVRLSTMLRGAELDEEEKQELSIEGVERLAVSRVDRVRVAIVAGELDGKEAALWRLAKLEGEVQKGGDLANDLYWLRRVYSDGPGVVSPEAHAALIDRHGWFGRLALAHGVPDSRPERYAVVGGGWGMLKLMRTFGQLQLLSLVGGAAVLFVVLGMVRNRVLVPQFDAGPGSPVYLETFVVFAGGFLLLLSMSLVMFGMGVEATVGALAVLEVMTWLLVAALGWPLLRRVEWRKFTQEIGLHRGQGVLLEIGAGVLGWLAWIPVVALVYLAEGLLAGDVEETTGPEGFPLFQSPPGDSWILLFLGMLSAVLWAPIVEEVVFRGALYRYLRPRVKVIGAVLITSAVFGLVHPYTTSGLVQVAIGGVVLALLREWRGSLIAPIVAHALHNGMITAVSVGMIAAMGD